MGLHLIAEDLESHVWYEQLVDRTVAEVESFAARWAAFEELVAALGEAEPDERSA
jgi:hypothetical protein